MTWWFPMDQKHQAPHGKKVALLANVPLVVQTSIAAQVFLAAFCMWHTCGCSCRWDVFPPTIHRPWAQMASSVKCLPCLLHILMIVADKQSCYVVTTWDNDRMDFIVCWFCLINTTTYAQHAIAVNDQQQFRKRVVFHEVVVWVNAFQLFRIVLMLHTLDDDMLCFHNACNCQPIFAHMPAGTVTIINSEGAYPYCSGWVDCLIRWTRLLTYT